MRRGRTVTNSHKAEKKMQEGPSILGRSVLYINVASRRAGPGETVKKVQALF